MKNKVTQIILLIVLLLATAAQTVIILDYYLDTYSLGIFNKEKSIDSYYRSFEEELYEDFMLPYRLIVKSGDSDSWIIEKSDALLYKQILTSVNQIVDLAIKDNPTLKYDSVNKWDSLYKSEGVTLEYRNDVPFEFLALINQSGEYINQDVNVEKIHIQPKEDNTVVLYVKTDTNVLVYENIKANGYLLQDEFNKLHALLMNNSKYKDMQYNYYSQILGNDRLAEINIDPDIPVIINAERIKNYPLIEMNVISIIREYNNTVSVNDRDNKVDAIKKILLGAAFDKHKTVVNANGDIFFSNEYNIYSLYEDGHFIYKFTPSNEGSEKGSVKNAFINAIEMVNKFFALNGETVPDIIISNVNSEENGYVFTFDYVFNEQLILFEGNESAITIKANGARVLEASGRLYDIEEYILYDEFGNVLKSVANDYYTSTLKIISDYKLQLLQNESNDILIGYVRSGKLTEYLEPQLILIDQTGVISSYPLWKVGE